MLVFITLGGCSAPPLTGDELHLCNAAQLLSASTAVTEETFLLGMDDRPEQAVERAVQALGLAESASRELHQVGAQKQAGPAWQSLIRSYKFAAEAASSLFPEANQLGVSGRESLVVARSALDEARVALPAACFTLSAR